MAMTQRSRQLIWVVVPIALAWFGCTSDNDGSWVDLTNRNVDVSPDVVETDVVDTTPDTVPDIVVDTTPEPSCGDGWVSNFEECEDNFLGTTCSRAGDFVGGTLSCNDDCTLDTSECEPPECSTDADCGDLVCNRGYCAEECLLDECMYGAEQSYVYSVLFPHPEEECCFDYNGDGFEDNTLLAFLTALDSIVVGADLDNRTQLDGFIVDPIAALLDYDVVPADLAEGGDVEFRVLLASSDLDLDGVPDATYDERVAGQGVFRVVPDSFDADGPRFPYHRGSVVGGELEAGPSTFPLTISFSDQLTWDLLVEEARIQGPITREDTGIFSVDDDSDGTRYGSARLGGIIPFARVLDHLNDLARECAQCGGFEDVASPLIYGEADDRYEVSCAAGVGQGTCGDDDGFICGNLGLVCSVGGIIGSYADIDTNGNNVNDAISVGMRLGLSGATLVDVTVP